MKGIKQLESGHWQADIRKAGFPRVRKTFRTKTLAVAWKARVLAAMADGTYITKSEQQAVAAAHLTIRDAADRYLKEISPAKRSAKSLETDSIALNQFCKCLSDTMPITEVTASHINDFTRYLSAERGNKANTVNRKLTVVSHLFTVAASWHVPGLGNPVTGQKKKLGPGGDRRSRNFKDDEESKLLAALDRCENPYIKPVVQLALETGMRRREILENTWKNVHLGKYPRIHIPAAIAKTALARNCPLSPAAVSVLQRVKKLSKKDTDCIFPITERAFIEAWKKTVVRAELEDFQFRDTRHIALTRLSKIYPRAQDLARISGHTKLETLLRYYEESITEQCEVMSAYYAQK